MKSRSCFLSLVVALLFILAPALAFAQASITGTVRDSSGAVLPGVTVEASSPALIEKVRTVVTDGNGLYRIVDLRPGTYSVTFSLSGFNSVKRDGLELAGSFVATVNADLQVGALTETITVSGQAAVVDVQSVKTERVLSQDVINALPSNKNYQTLLNLVPGMGGPTAGVGNQQDVGGSAGEAQIQFAIHGGRGNDQRFTVNGVTFNEGNGSTHALGLNVVAMQEMAVGTGAADATLAQGGVRLNYVPKSGGNMYSGGFYYSGTSSSLQSDNITPELKARGLPEVNKMKSLWDISPSGGGPIVRDKLWVFGHWRRQVTENFLANRYTNKNAGDPNAWTYDPDLAQQMVGATKVRWSGARVTWQANERNKIGFGFDGNTNCLCPNQGGTYSPEAGRQDKFHTMHYWNLDWSSPLTNRVLLDAAAIYHPGAYDVISPETAYPTFVQVTDNAPPRSYGNVTQYRGSQNRTVNEFPTFNARTSVSYVTGTHSANVGLSFGRGKNLAETYRDLPYSYIFTNQVPTSIVQYAYPLINDQRLDAEVGLWAQDRWTMRRLTLSGAVRFDYLKTSSAEVHLGPTTWLPNRDITFAQTDIIDWKDITPRLGAVYDLFGNGRTALRTSLNKYLINQGAGGPGNPAGLYVSTATRSWTDANGNYIPDCDLSNFGLQDTRATGGDLCGAFTGSGVNFGKAVSGTTIDPAILNGWGARGFNWEFSAGVQQQLAQRVSMDVAYFRRWYGNFQITDNRALAATDYDTFSVVAPSDPRLPDGGGYTVAGLVNVRPDKATLAPDNYQTFAKNYGTQIEHWNGVDVNVNARLGTGFFLQGGTSTGRTSSDNCEIAAQVPEVMLNVTRATANQDVGNNPAVTNGIAPQQFCAIQTNWLTQIKGLGSYVVPKVDVQFSATFQSRPGPERLANYVVTSANASQSLGRPLSANAANVVADIVAPGTEYGERVNQIDLRMAKILRFGRTRSNVSVDLFNLTNINAVLTESNNYSNWLTPGAVVAGRVVKFTVQTDF